MEEPSPDHCEKIRHQSEQNQDVTPVDQPAPVEGESFGNEYFTVFDGTTREEVYWFFLAFLIAASIFVIEYEWISRPFISQRQSGALDRGPRSDYLARHPADPTWLAEVEKSITQELEDHFDEKIKKLKHPGCNKCIEDLTAKKEKAIKEFGQRLKLAGAQRQTVFRLHEASTFPYVVVRLWLPSIFVRVNLGFDRLDHRGVTHAMLFGLANAYRQKFLTWRSPYHVVGRVMLALTILILVAASGREFFDMPLRQEPLATEQAEKLNILEQALVTQAERTVRAGQDGDTGASGSSAGDGAVRDTAPVSQRPYTGTIDYCLWLQQLNDERAWRKAQVAGQANESRSESDFFEARFQARAMVPSIGCNVNPKLTNALLPLLFAPILELSLDNQLDPEVSLDDASYDLKNHRTRPVFILAHINNGLPELRYRNDGAGTGVAAAGQPALVHELWQQRTLSFRVYHLILLMLFYWVATFLLRRYPILPYRQLHRDILELGNSLTQSRTERTRPGRFGLKRMVGLAFDDESETESQREVLDPRSVELALMQILEEIQNHRRRIVLTPAIVASIPTPEVHFVFDEIDKIGGVVAADETVFGISEKEREAVDAERRRTYALHALLSDMKRVISSAPARFIFVGGRALHDEWIRDLNRMGTRQPLLSGIFDAELYLPSLLLDLPRSVYDNREVYEDGDRSLVNRADGKIMRALNARVIEYFANLYASAQALNGSLKISRLAPFYALKGEIDRPPRFVENWGASADPFEDIRVVDWRRKKLVPGVAQNRKWQSGEDTKHWLLQDLVNFLAFRSAGSPKKLREIVSGMIRPSGSFAGPDTHERFQLFPDRDMMVIDATDLYRIQFISSVFRHIETNFGEILTRRDDKVTLNVFFLFDYLMKMHGRAFSLHSLERLDELAHIHRAPDLRRMLEKVVGASSEQYFHRMLNGLYSYRFQSDLAMEIRFLSRLSEPEMAALNFTLDESQELKTTYAEMLSASGEENPDIVSALGELYEYDQAYDVARGYYEKALRMADDELVRQVGQTIDLAPVPAAPARDGDKEPAMVRAIRQLIESGALEGGAHLLDAIFRGSDKDRRLVAYFMPWAVRRLRLMMQIGLTFEQIGDEERAQAQYYSAHMLARTITDVAFPREEMPEDGWTDLKWVQMLIENLNLLYQPLMSVAWISEKLEGSIDTSTFMVEQELADFARRFDFIRNPKIAFIGSEKGARDRLKTYTHKGEDGKNETRLTSDTKHQSGHAGENLSIQVAEMHNKAGDLYFYKGRATLVPTLQDGIRALIDTLRNDGSSLAKWTTKMLGPVHYNQKTQVFRAYLPTARYHYCIALHRLRHFVVFRFFMSNARLNKTSPNPDQTLGLRHPTLRPNFLPSFVNLALASSLVDLAETVFAGETVLLILEELGEFQGIRGSNGKRKASEFQAGAAGYLDVESLLEFAQPNRTELFASLSQCLNRWIESEGQPSIESHSPNLESTVRQSG
ncbi:MAG: hypothetical protein R3D85_05100 [Paracoccaceae bacterium]